MPHWMLSILLLVLAAVPFAILWKIRKSKHDGWLYLLASLSILFLTAALLIWTPLAYESLGGTTFMPPVPEKGGGAFDAQSYSGFLQILFGVPVAVAGSLYAILLARQSERQSSQFNAYEIRKNFRDRLEERNVVVGRFAKSLRDINNTCYVLLAQVDRAIGALPDSDEARDNAVNQIRKETARIEEDGFPMLRAALEDYRDATIAVQEGGIILDKQARPPLDIIQWHFYQGSPDGQQGLAKAILARDYQAAADRFLIRAYRLSANDLIRARLERLAQSIVRWSDDPVEHEHWKDLRDYVLSSTDVTTADISSALDHVGFRFIGPALIRIDRYEENHNAFKLKCRIDLGTAILLDSCLALPTKQQSMDEIRQWDEWTFLESVTDQEQRSQLLASVPDRSLHFPQVFSDEVSAIQELYSYPQDAATRDYKTRASAARLDYRALFYYVPPRWMDEAYDDLTAKITGDAPISKLALADHLASIAASIQITKIDNARSASMAAINRIVQAMGGAVERQFTKLGAAGQHEFRRCLLTIWAEQVDREHRIKVRAQLQQLLSASTDVIATAQLHLDLFDCDLALGDREQANQHFAEAQAIVSALPAPQLNDSKWFGQYRYDAPETILEPQIVLLSAWLSGYLMKQRGEFTFADNFITEVEVAMPDGFLPLVWLTLANSGLISLPGGAQAILAAGPKESFFDLVIPLGLGEWQWEPELVSAEIARRLDHAWQAGQASFLDQIYEQFAQR